MAANFNIVPVALLELPDQHAVIKAQMPTALLLLAANTAIMYTLRLPMTDLDRPTASRFASIALAHVRREYPNKLDHVLTGPGDVRSPRELHPVFYGSFDWHSNVHGYWLLATLVRIYPDLAEAGTVGALFDEQLVPSKVEREVAYLAGAERGTFERPYGWAWLLMLAAELRRHETDPGRRWSAALTPLAGAFARSLSRLSAKGYVPDPGRDALQHRVRPRPGSRVRGRSRATTAYVRCSGIARPRGTRATPTVRRGNPAATTSSRRR